MQAEAVFLRWPRPRVSLRWLMAAVAAAAVVCAVFDRVYQAPLRRARLGFASYHRRIAREYDDWRTLYADRYPPEFRDELRSAAEWHKRRAAEIEQMPTFDPAKERQIAVRRNRAEEML